MTRRTLLAGLAGLVWLLPAWGQGLGRERVAQMLLGESVEAIPEEVCEDLDLLMTRLSGLSQSRLESVLRDWPEGEQAARQVIRRMLDPWNVCAFAQRPGHPPATRTRWEQSWPG